MRLLLLALAWLLPSSALAESSAASLADVFSFAGQNAIWSGENGELVDQNLAARMPGLGDLVEAYAQPDSVPSAEVAPGGELGVAAESGQGAADKDDSSAANPAQELELVVPPVVSPFSP
ncbi:MAG: hypothetical protein HY921_11540 [Elusimicrobia bacterium]|nr:hypothetical protein [Elusimicrobiota bacterium]